MADRTEGTVVIAAEPAAILDVIADIGSYPEWANGIKEAEVLDSGADGRPVRARFKLDAGPIKDEYELMYTWSEDEVSWTLGRGKVFTTMDGSYTLAPVESGIEVAYRLKVDMSMPMLGMIKRKAERMVVDTALKDLRQRVEG